MSQFNRNPLPMTFSVLEIARDGSTYGFAVQNKTTNETAYQISAPWGEEREYSVIQVVREEPFEFVELGYHPTQEEAFAIVRRHIVASEVARARAKRNK
jgi:hypothetical protein